MAMPRQVAKKLRAMLGDDDGGAMSDWLDSLDSKTDELRAAIAEVRQETHAVREEIRVGFARLAASDSELREEMRVGFAQIRVANAELRETVAKELAGAFKWGIGIWITSFGAMVAALALLLGGSR